MRIGPRVIYVHIPKTGGTTVSAYLEREVMSYRQPGHTWHDDERACLRPGVDPRTHLGAVHLRPEVFTGRQLWATMRDPVDWYPSMWSQCGAECGPMVDGVVRVLAWDEWLAWALGERVGVMVGRHPTPAGDAYRAGASLLWWLWDAQLHGRRPHRLLWTHRLAEDLPGCVALNRAVEDHGRTLPTVTPEQAARIRKRDGWVRSLRGWDRW